MRYSGPTPGALQSGHIPKCYRFAEAGQKRFGIELGALHSDLASWKSENLLPVVLVCVGPRRSAAKNKLSSLFKGKESGVGRRLTQTSADDWYFGLKEKGLGFAVCVRGKMVFERLPPYPPLAPLNGRQSPPKEDSTG
jgi:hypothetical protein